MTVQSDTTLNTQPTITNALRAFTPKRVLEYLSLFMEGFTYLVYCNVKGLTPLPWLAHPEAYCGSMYLDFKSG